MAEQLKPPPAVPVSQVGTSLIPECSTSNTAPTNVSGKADNDSPNSLAPQPTRETWKSSRLMASDSPTSGYCCHLGSEPANGRFSFSVYTCLSNKNESSKKKNP